MGRGLQYVALAGLFLTGLGTSIQGLHSWQEAASTAFVGGTVLQLGSVILAVFIKSPGQDK